MCFGLFGVLGPVPTFPVRHVMQCMSSSDSPVHIKIRVISCAQASKWLEAHLRAKSPSLEVTNMHDARFGNTLELAVRFGKTLIVQVGVFRGRGRWRFASLRLPRRPHRVRGRCVGKTCGAAAAACLQHGARAVGCAAAGFERCQARA